MPVFFSPSLSISLSLSLYGKRARLSLAEGTSNWATPTDVVFSFWSRLTTIKGDVARLAEMLLGDDGGSKHAQLDRRGNDPLDAPVCVVDDNLLRRRRRPQFGPPPHPSLRWDVDSPPRPLHPQSRRSRDGGPVSPNGTPATTTVAKFNYAARSITDSLSHRLREENNRLCDENAMLLRRVEALERELVEESLAKFRTRSSWWADRDTATSAAESGDAARDIGRGRRATDPFLRREWRSKENSPRRMADASSSCDEPQYRPDRSSHTPPNSSDEVRRAALALREVVDAARPLLQKWGRTSLMAHEFP